MPNSLALIRHEGACQGILPPSRIRLRSYASERTLSALWADSAPERRTGRGLPGARGAARARPRVALVCAPRGPPRRIARRVCPHPPWCARLGPGPLRPSLPGPWALGPGSPAPFSPLRPRRCARAPWALGARLPSGSRAGAPAAAGRACPPHGLPVRPGLRCSAGFLAGDRSPLFAAPVPPGLRGGPACSPLRCRGGPWARLGPPPARCCPPSLHPAGARAACGPRLLGALRPRRGLVLLGLFLCACRCGCRLACAAWRACSARAALAGGNPIQKVLSVGARSERGQFAQGRFFPRLMAGSVRIQLRY